MDEHCPNLALDEHMIEVQIDYKPALTVEFDSPTDLLPEQIRRCALGLVTEFPSVDVGGSPPTLAAFNTRRWAHHPRRHGQNGETFLDTVYGSALWTYRLWQAYVTLGADTTNRRGLSSFEVGLLTTHEDLV